MPMRDFSDDEKAQRRAQALEMRRAGQDVEYIARKLNYPSVYACKVDLGKAFSEVLKMPKDEAKALDLLRLDRMILALWPDAREGIVSAIDRVVKLIDMRAKFLGTYAPTQVEQITLDAIEQEIRKLEQENSTAARKAISKSPKPRKPYGESPA